MSYMHAYIHAFRHTNIHTYLHTYIPTYIHTYIHIILTTDVITMFSPCFYLRVVLTFDLSQRMLESNANGKLYIL